MGDIERKTNILTCGEGFLILSLQLWQSARPSRRDKGMPN